MLMKNQWLNCQNVASMNFAKFTGQLRSQLAIKTVLKVSGVALVSMLMRF